MPEFYRLGMTKEEINETLQTAVLEPKPVVAGNFAAFTEDGQIIDSEKSAEDFAPALLDKNLTLYVNATTGRDSNDGLTAEQPKKTIMAAVNAIPKNLGGHTAKINIATGTYPEAVKIEGFYGSNYSNNFGVQLIGDSAESVTIAGGTAAFGCRVPLYLKDLSISGNYSGNVVSARQCAFLLCGSCDIDGSEIAIGGAAVYFEINDGAIFNTTISNTKGMAVAVTEGMLYVNALYGNSNNIGIQSGSDGSALPALVVAGTISIDADIKYKKVRGGTIIENGVLI